MTRRRFVCYNWLLDRTAPSVRRRERTPTDRGGNGMDGDRYDIDMRKPLPLRQAADIVQMDACRDHAGREVQAHTLTASGHHEQRIHYGRCVYDGDEDGHQRVVIDAQIVTTSNVWQLRAGRHVKGSVSDERIDARDQLHLIGAEIP